MRSARTVSLNSSAPNGMSMLPPISASNRESLARRSISKRANHSAMRRKRGHQNARASGKSASGAKCRVADLDQRRDRIVRQLVRERPGEFADGVVDQMCRDRAAPGGVSMSSSGCSPSMCLA